MLEFGSWSLPSDASREADDYKEYEVRALKTGDATWGGYTNTGVIYLAEGTSGLDRFYVMKITNESGSYNWTNAHAQFDQDGDSWRIPTKTEWPIFAGSFGIGSNYNNSTYGLSRCYWSSTEQNSSNTWIVDFGDDHMYGSYYTNTYNVRLCTTF